jgi:hypothetical protein
MSLRHTRNLRRLGNSIRINIPTDDGGYTGRECPNKDCLKYFKVTFGTGLRNSMRCVCPYCGTTEEHDHFWTQDQIGYAQSVAQRKLLEAVHKDLKSMEFEVKPPRNSMFGIGMSLKVQPFRPPPIRRYGEKELETHVVCDRCTLRYAIYGVFGYCPDCGAHNSLNILEANLELVEKMLALAEQQGDSVLGLKLVENALEDCVSAFDGWGRATATAFSAKASDADKAAKLSFQNLRRAQQRVISLFGYDLASPLASNEFSAAHTLFQKRHLVAHCMGVVDQAYIDGTGDHAVPAGRKVRFAGAEIRAATAILRRLAAGFLSHVEGLP